ncbi:hypothetical protein M5K25_000646 [Dendrobium thyrsiflorum]|uniref:Uncharacterized protein n=1 Tax=Dendrobium thyrsiflorum TaxID=117978 RepID=A0ABD0VUC0_DENTH
MMMDPIKILWFRHLEPSCSLIYLVRGANRPNLTEKSLSAAMGCFIQGFNVIGEHTGFDHDCNLIVSFDSKTIWSEEPDHNYLLQSAVFTIVSLLMPVDQMKRAKGIERRATGWLSSDVCRLSAAVVLRFRWGRKEGVRVAGMRFGRDDRLATLVRLIIQKGQIGINIYTMWFKPLTNSTEDAMATKRARDFILGWILNPIFFGDYPEIMKKNAGSRLPSFSYSESQKVKGSYDFIGYGLGVVDTMNDVGRITFLRGFIGSVLDSIRNGIDVRGYFIWTFVDGYELLSGYSTRFGLYHVNFEDSEHERTPKLSAHWYRNFLRKGTLIKEKLLCSDTVRPDTDVYSNTKLAIVDGLGSLVRIQTLQASFHIK